MTLNQLGALVAIVENGSVQSAAKALGVSRATVDTHIRELEAFLGLQLLTRTPTGTSLTAPGEHLLPRARRLLSEAAALADGFRAEALGAPKVVHFQLSIALPQVAHVLAISTISELYPDLRFRISFLESHQTPLSDEVHMRLQFGGAPAAGPFRTFVLARIPLKLQATSSYLAEHTRPTSLAELTSHRLLLWSFLDDHDNSLPLVEGGHLPITPYLRSHDAGLVGALVARRAGIGFLPVPFVPVPGFDEPLEDVMPEQVGSFTALRAIIPERLAELEVTRRVVETTQALSRLYNAGELVWQREA